MPAHPEDLRAERCSKIIWKKKREKENKKKRVNWNELRFHEKGGSLEKEKQNEYWERKRKEWKVREGLGRSGKIPGMGAESGDSQGVKRGLKETEHIQKPSGFVPLGAGVVGRIRVGEIIRPGKLRQVRDTMIFIYILNILFILHLIDFWLVANYSNTNPSRRDDLDHNWPEQQLNWRGFFLLFFIKVGAEQQQRHSFPPLCRNSRN